MYNISIIGGGQLGSRHLQGLQQIDLMVSLFVVDTNPTSLEISKQRFEEGNTNPMIQSISYLSDINELPTTLDLVIIATSSIPRFQITRKLLLEKKVKFIVFEKFLFPSLSDYAVISNEIKKNQTKAWVNCPRRMFSYYTEIKNLLKDCSEISYNVSGGEWGMACNSIHFIDIFAMITNENFIKIDLSGLDKKIIESKRSGYIEFTGVITGETPNNQKLFLSSSYGSTEPILTTIKTTKYNILLNESENSLSVYNLHTKENYTKKIQLLYQSQLTGILSKQILLKGNCLLPTYAESANLHINFLKPAIDFYNNLTGASGNSCPIT